MVWSLSAARTRATSELIDAFHQRANDPDHHDRRDDGHYQVHYLLHFQVSNRSHLAVINYEML